MISKKGLAGVHASATSGRDLAMHGALAAGRLDPVRDLAGLVGWHEAGHLVEAARTSSLIREPEASEADQLAKVTQRWRFSP